MLQYDLMLEGGSVDVVEDVIADKMVGVGEKPASIAAFVRGHKPARHDSNRVVVWFGAGISIAAPSSLPSGADLTWRWLEHLMPTEDVAILRALYQRTGRLLNHWIPRLEG